MRIGGFMCGRMDALPRARAVLAVGPRAVLHVAGVDFRAHVLGRGPVGPRGRDGHLGPSRYPASVGPPLRRRSMDPWKGPVTLESLSLPTGFPAGGRWNGWRGSRCRDVRLEG